MSQRVGFISVMLLATALTAAPAAAQKVEASLNVGYSASEGIAIDQRALLGVVYDKLAIDSGSSFHFTIGFLANEQSEFEFLFGRQNSRLQADGPVGTLPLSELSVYSYMGNYVYNWGTHDARVRPYFFGGIGATQYSFGDNLVAGSTRSIGGETRFATNWGGGVKFYFSPNVGVKVGIRWTPTYIKSDPAGVWCDPFYGCWELGDPDYSHQFETSGGVTFRF